MTFRTGIVRAGAATVLVALLAVVLAADRAAGQSSGDEYPPGETPYGGVHDEFMWMYQDEETGSWYQDDDRRAAFAQCMKVVDWVVHAREGDDPGWHYGTNADDWPWARTVDEDLWNRAVDRDFFGTHDRPDRFFRSEFEYRPHCDALLPDDWITQLPDRYLSDAFTRCLGSAGTNPYDYGRPPPVPAWYWLVSLDDHRCYLLLPLGAFGLGDDQDDRNAWSDWDEERSPIPDPPSTSGRDADAVSEYNECREFVRWRMEGGKPGPLDGGAPPDPWKDPPHNAAPSRVWHQAIDYWADGEPPGAVSWDPEVTSPASWDPDCELLLEVNACVPTSGFLPEQCLGPAPLASYDIGYSRFDGDEGILADDGDESITRIMWGSSTDLAFTIGKGAVQVALWAVDWSFNGFDVARYDEIATRIGERYQTNLLGHPRFPLKEMLWLVLFAWSAFMALKGRLALAGAEVATTFMLVAFTGVLLANTQMYMSSLWTLMDEASATVIVAGMGRDPEATDGTCRDPDTGEDDCRAELTTELQTQVQVIFVEQPYDYLSWGQWLGEPDGHPNNPQHPEIDAGEGNELRACAEARNQILLRGPHGSDPWPRIEMMDESRPECHELAKFNANPSGTRLLSALLVMGVSVSVAVLLVLVALTVVLGKLIALLMFGLVPFVAVAAIPPAYGRRFLWSWLSTLLQVTIVVIGMSFLLSLLLIAVHELATRLPGLEPLERFALMLFLVLLIFAARRYLLRGGQVFAARLSEYMSAPRPPGVTWAGTAGTASPGVDLTMWERPAGYGAAYGAIGVGVLAGRSALIRNRERRSAKRSYKNLERVSYWKRDKNFYAARRRQAFKGRAKGWRINQPVQ